MSPSPTESPVTIIGDVCPELVLTSLPADLRLTDRKVVDGAPLGSGVRTQYQGTGSRELTVLAGVAGEVPGVDSGERLSVRGHQAVVLTIGADTVAVRWRERGEREPCSQYAIVATAFAEDEVDSIVAGVR